MTDWSPVDLLPGIWFLVLAALLLAALARWYDRLPATVLAVFCAALLLLFAPVLFGGRLLVPLDLLRGEVPFRGLAPTEPHGNVLQGDLLELVAPSAVAVREAYGAGRWPLWNPRVGAGMPLLADPQAQALQPLVLATWPLPYLRAAGVLAALRVGLALVFTFLLLRRQGLHDGPALAGSLAFGLGGFVLLWVGWPLASSAALLPAMLYAVVRCDDPGHRRDALLLALTTAALLLAGHPETVIYVLALTLAFLAARALHRPQGTRRRLLATAGLALFLGACLAAPVLLPAADYLPQTLRASRLTDPGPEATARSTGRPDRVGLFPRASENLRPPGERGAREETYPVRALTQGMEGLDRWIETAAPAAFGNSRYLYYWGLLNTNEDAAGFAGTATLLVALLALPIAHRRRLPQESLILGATAVALLLLAFLPSHLLAGGRLLLLVAFGLAYLGAATLERCRNGELPRRRTVLLIATGLAALLLWAYLAHPDPTDPHRLDLLRHGVLRWQLRILVLTTLLLLLPRRRALVPSLRRSERLVGGCARTERNLSEPPRAGGRAPFGGEFEHRPQHIPPTGRPARTLPWAVAALLTIELLIVHRPANPPSPKRLALPVTPPIQYLKDHLDPDGSGYRMAALGRAFPPNLPSLYALTDARVYNPMAPAPYLRHLTPLLAAWEGEVPELAAPTDPLYPRLGVRYLLDAPTATCPPPLATAFHDETALVCEIPGPLPLLSTPTGPAERLPGDPTHLAARVGGSSLRTTLYQDGNWRLLLDGATATAAVQADDGPFLAAALPQGPPHRLDLLYRPAPFLAGCLLAALALAAGAGLYARPPAHPR